MKTHAYSSLGMGKLASLRWSANVKPFISVVLDLWFGLVFVLAENGAFVRPREVPPLPILLGATVPLVVFAAAYLGSSVFRALILAADLRLLTAIQAWRA